MEERINVGFGWSNDADARKAGLEAARAALENRRRADIAFVFATVGYDPSQLLAGVNEGLRGIPIHGGTSFTGIITPAGYLGGETDAVGVLTMSTPQIDFGTGYAELGDDPEAAGRAAAEMALKRTDIASGKPEAVLMTASPGDEEAIMRGIAQVVGEDVPIIGGSVADNTVEGKWHIFANQTSMSSGVVVTVLFSELPLGYFYGSGYRPTDKKAVATKSEGRTVYELDGKKAVEVYADWTGQDPASLAGMNILGASILSPVGVYNKDNDFYLVKHPGIAQDDGSIALFAEVSEGDEIVLMEASVDDLIGEVASTIKAAMDMSGLEAEDVAGLILVHCGGRRGGIDARIGEVADVVKKTLGEDVPFISYLTFGEQGCLPNGENVHGDLLLSALVIGK